MKLFIILNLLLNLSTINCFYFPVNCIDKIKNNSNKPNKYKVLMNTNEFDNFVPDFERRVIMNNILLASSAVPVLWMLGGFIYFLIPPNKNSGNKGLIAKDANGDDVLASKWIQLNSYPERKLVQGLKGDAHYLITNSNNELEKYAINAVCTHLGCVVPWNRAAGKFMCPCHGSQYDATGKVIRGPAPQSLALANVDVLDDKVVLSEWNSIDFRTNQEPWWIK